MNNNFDIKYADKLIQDEEYEELFKYSRENAENGDFVAMRYLGLCYEYGMGIDADEYIRTNIYNNYINQTTQTITPLERRAFYNEIQFLKRKWYRDKS